MNDLLRRITKLDSRYKKPLILISGVLVIIILFGVTVSMLEGRAAEKPAPTTSQQGGIDLVTDPFGLIANVGLRTGLVLVLLYLLYALVRWWQGSRQTHTQKRMMVIDTVRLSPRQALHLIRIDGQEFLIGATDSAMNLIAEIEPDADITLAGNAAPDGAPDQGFDHLFKKKLAERPPEREN